MCTSLRMGGEEEGAPLLFGRNMDIEKHFGETVVVTPRQYPISLRQGSTTDRHYAFIGTAIIQDGYPLYADAMNEKGVCMAGLHFPGNAAYAPLSQVPYSKQGLAPFELIPYLLSRCASIAEVRQVLEKIVLIDLPFSKELPNTPLHWHIAAKDGGLILESTVHGLQIYDDLFGVLANNPPYPYHTMHMHQYDSLTPYTPPPFRDSETFLGDTYDLGLGMVGLPGDYTSPSRFARCALLKRWTHPFPMNSKALQMQFFRILSAVAPPAGCVITENGEIHTTLYTACMDIHQRAYTVVTAEGEYHSSTLNQENMDGEKLLIDS